MLRASLEPEFFDIDEADTGRRGVERVSEGMPDVVLLDLKLPDIDGIEVARELRGWTQVPIIVVSSRTEEHDKLGAFEAGADDYLAKPFSTRELIARIRVCLRHGTGGASTFDHAGVKVDLKARRVWKNDTEVHLTPYEYDLLAVLVQSAGKVVPHEHLLRRVWGEEYAGEVQYLRVYIGQLRHKLEQMPGRPKLLVTEPGVGYRLRNGE